jgi:O-antigen ligase
MPGFEAAFKLIPNNIYIELLCESGIFAFIIFCLIFINLIVKVNGNDFVHLKSGLIIALIYFCAFPTYTMLFIWVFIAVIAVEQKRQNNDRIQFNPSSQ